MTVDELHRRRFEVVRAFENVVRYDTIPSDMSARLDRSIYVLLSLCKIQFSEQSKLRPHTLTIIEKTFDLLTACENADGDYFSKVTEAEPAIAETIKALVDLRPEPERKRYEAVRIPHFKQTKNQGASLRWLLKTTCVPNALHEMTIIDLHQGQGVIDVGSIKIVRKNIFGRLASRVKISLSVTDENFLINPSECPITDSRGRISFEVPLDNPIPLSLDVGRIRDLSHIGYEMAANGQLNALTFWVTINGVREHKVDLPIHVIPNHCITVDIRYPNDDGMTATHEPELFFFGDKGLKINGDYERSYRLRKRRVRIPYWPDTETIALSMMVGRLLSGGTPDRWSVVATVDHPLQLIGHHGQLQAADNPVALEVLFNQSLSPTRKQFDVRVSLTFRKDNGEINEAEIIIPLDLFIDTHRGRLAIDFGTSAIAVAYQGGDAFSKPELKDLMHEDCGGLTLAEYDNSSPERGGPFLPSIVACDSASRNGTSDCRPGFPARRANEQALPGSAEYISLPATDDAIRFRTGRIAISLKHWLGSYSDYVLLPDKTPIPREQLASSVFAALFSAYLHKIDNVDELVLCHPNTFSDTHKELLKSAIRDAAEQTGRTDLTQNILLVGEADAVLAHCFSDPAGPIPHDGDTTLVVYDMGAGTLDLTLARIHASRNSPTSISILNRIGVPIAGGTLDEILAIIVDTELKKIRVENYGLVCKSPRPPFSHAERSSAEIAIDIELWKEIVAAKQRMTSTAQPMFCVEIGTMVMSAPAVNGTSLRELTQVTDLANPPLAAQSYLGIHGSSRKIVLCIPCNEMNNYGMMERFLRCVTVTAMDKLLAPLSMSCEDLNMIIGSGRATQWPWIANRIQSWLTPTHRKKWYFVDAMHVGASRHKQVVVEGALYWAHNKFRSKIHDTGVFRPVFGALIQCGDKRYFLREGEDKSFVPTLESSVTPVQAPPGSKSGELDHSRWEEKFLIQLKTPLILPNNVPTPVAVRRTTDNKFEINVNGQRHQFLPTVAASQTIYQLPWPIGPLHRSGYDEELRRQR